MVRTPGCGQGQRRGDVPHRHKPRVGKWGSQLLEMPFLADFWQLRRSLEHVPRFVKFWSDFFLSQIRFARAIRYARSTERGFDGIKIGNGNFGVN
jgi:hypothetical protein